jgi:REP element-mobilizing transposase RayT
MDKKETMPYYRLFYHLVWATKNRSPLLTSEVEPIIHNFLRTKAIGLGGTVFALNGIEDHVHLVGSIPPKIAVAKFVGQIKAVASTKFNQQYSHLPAFLWQAEYGAFTLDGKRLANVIAYVERQKEHHAQKTTIPVLERLAGEATRPILRELTGMYTLNDDNWRREMMALDADAPPGDKSLG